MPSKICDIPGARAATTYFDARVGVTSCPGRGARLASLDERAACGMARWGVVEAMTVRVKVTSSQRSRRRCE